MKRVAIVLLLAALLLAGCSKEKAEPGQKTFYYKSTHVTYDQSGSILGGEYRDVHSYKGNMTTILNVYTDGPKSADLQNVFPLGCEVIEFTLVGNVASVRFNSVINQLQGISQTVAFVCMSRTVMELVDVDRVRISVENTLLSGKEYVEFTRENVLYFDNSKTLGG